MVRQKGSLRRKIITWSFVPTAIILVAVALISLYAYQRVTESLVIDRDRELTRLSARMLGSELAAFTNPLADQYLAIFDGMVFLDAKGNLVAAEPMQYEKNPSWFRINAIQEAFRTSRPVFSDLMTDSTQGNRLITVVLPAARRDGQPSGGILAFFHLDPATDNPLCSSIDKLRRGQTSSAYLVDSKGLLICHAQSDLIGSDFSGLDPVRSVLAGESGSLHTRGSEAQDVVASFAPVPGTEWGLVTEESWAALTESSRRYGRYLFLLLAAGIAAPMVIVAIGLRRITRPIARLISAAQEIAAGNFEQRIAAPTGDEMESLAEQFNLMAGQLQESYAHLEQKVSDRTRELAALNTIAAEVSRSLALDEVLNEALDSVLAVMSMERGKAFCLEEETGELGLVTQRGIPDDLIPEATRLAATDCDVWQAIRSGKPTVRVESERSSRERDENKPDEQLIICVPLLARNRALGAIRLESGSPRGISGEELALLAAIGSQVGMAVDNALLYEKAQQLAIVGERNRLARDLHDSVTQALYGVTLYAEAAARQIAAGDAVLAAGHLDEIRATAQDALREMRLLIFELRPAILKSEGLAAALQARLEAVEGRVGIATQFTTSGDCDLAPAVQKELYRVAQEALNNVLKHAMARNVWVQLRGNGETVTLQVADDGIGFDPGVAHEQGGFGLHSMQERIDRLGARLGVHSEPGAGTTVQVEVCR